MAERLFNTGYVGAAVETTAGTAVTPTDYFESYDVSITTNRNLQELEPAAGNVYSTQAVVAGLRDHTGDMTLIFEPNTAEKLFAMMLAVGSKTGTDPYTSTGTLSASAPKSYTFDIASGNIVQRYMGCQVGKLSMEVNSNEIRIKPSISALASFQGREIATVSTTTITLKTDYDPKPNNGLVASDLVRLYKISDGTTLDTTVSSVNADGITVVLGASAAAFAAGDMIYLPTNCSTSC